MPANPARRLLVEKLASKETDAFGYRRLAEEIAETLRSTQGPFVYAICGSWGSGKSSLLKFLFRELADKEETAPMIVYFNALGSLVHQDLLAALVHRISDQAKAHSTRHNTDTNAASSVFNEEAVKKCIGVLLETGVKATAGTVPLAGFFANLYLQAKAQKDSDLLADPARILTAEKVVRDGFDELSKSIAGTGATAYVFIDELDRCPPKEAVRVIEALKMVFSGPDELARLSEQLNSDENEQLVSHSSPFKYVLAIDEEYITRAFSRQYGLSGREAYSYSTKFIQFRYHFPNKEWRSFLEPIVFGLRDDGHLYPDGTVGCLAEVFLRFGLKNPRDARHVLAYLVTWHYQYYEKYRVKENLSRAADESTIRIRFLALAGYLAVYACLKALFPQFVRPILRRNIFPALVEEQDRMKVCSERLRSSIGPSRDQEVVRTAGLSDLLSRFPSALDAIDEFIKTEAQLSETEWNEARHVVRTSLDDMFGG